MTNITYHFFADVLKLHKSTMNAIKKQLDLVGRFFQDLSMKYFYILSDKSKITDKI